jgi:hypothetical protein
MKCSEHLKELDRNVGETEVDQTDANPGTDYKDICWQDGRRIVELKTLAEQLKTAFIIIRLEASAFKFLRNRLFMTSMQLPRKMSRSLL